MCTAECVVVEPGPEAKVTGSAFRIILKNNKNIQGTYLGSDFAEMSAKQLSDWAVLKFGSDQTSGPETCPTIGMSALAFLNSIRARGILQSAQMSNGSLLVTR